MPAESEYCGGYSKTYMFGEGAGATFMNNFIAGSRDELIGRVAGYFTYGGEMAERSEGQPICPAYIVNGSDTAVHKFREANDTDSYSFSDGVAEFYNSQVPFRKVCVASDTEGDVGKWMAKAFRDMFMYLQRSDNVSTKYLEPLSPTPIKATSPLHRFPASRSRHVTRFLTAIPQ